jgi:hypothetical protein
MKDNEGIGGKHIVYSKDKSGKFSVSVHDTADSRDYEYSAIRLKPGLDIQGIGRKQMPAGAKVSDLKKLGATSVVRVPTIVQSKTSVSPGQPTPSSNGDKIRDAQTEHHGHGNWGHAGRPGQLGGSA